MNNKINIDVFVPSINKTYNIFIPVNKTIGEVIVLLNKAINELTFNEFPIFNNLSLIDAYSNVIYNTNYSVKQNKIPNGSKLILM